MFAFGLSIILPCIGCGFLSGTIGVHEITPVRPDLVGPIDLYTFSKPDGKTGISVGSTYITIYSNPQTVDQKTNSSI